MAESDGGQVEQVRLQLEIMRAKRDKAIAKRDKAAIELEKARLRATQKPGRDHAERRSRPGNPAWDTWPHFCADLQRLQALTGKGDEATKSDVYAVSGVSERVITYAMQGYGLDPRDWPSSRWNPKEHRVYRSPRHG